MKRPLWKRAGYQTIKTIFWLIAVVCFRFRWQGKEYFPSEGGALVCGNHQSYFDPALIGICFPGQANFLARGTLFTHFLFGTIIRYLEAIPIDREGMSLGGIKETLKRLKRGEMVVLFPEGTRTEDGGIREFKPGFVALARRGKVPILPVAVDGAYDAWPRDKKLPRLTKVCTVFGPPISAEEIKQMSDDELIDAVRQRVMACHQRARTLRGIESAASTPGEESQ
ncbi:MAG: lysophospholipid acyltransferase family protein [Planctomycetota bacterium]